MGRPHRSPCREGMPRDGSDAQLVKSAARVFEILELLDELRRSATVMEITAALDYPQSSTSALLRSMVSMGYLVHDRHQRTYRTSSRVALLGTWVKGPFLDEGPIVALMNAFAQANGVRVVLGMRNGVNVQYAHTVAPAAASAHLALTSAMPLTCCAAGHAILATLDDPEIDGIATRLNASAAGRYALFPLKALRIDLVLARQRGYATFASSQGHAGACLAVALPLIEDQPRMALGIVGDVAEERERRLASELMDIAAALDAQGIGPRAFPGAVGATVAAGKSASMQPQSRNEDRLLPA